MLDRTINNIIEEISQELDIEKNVVSLAVTSEFKFVANKMKENLSTKEDPTITLNFLGKFKVKRGRRMHIDFVKEKSATKLFNLAKTNND